MKLEIYTDGSAVAQATSENYMKGGMGVVFVEDGEVTKKISQGYYPTKTGRMEVMAMLTALRNIKTGQKATIYSDSMYVVNCFRKGWMAAWEQNNWPTRIKNQDLLKPLLEEYKRLSKDIDVRHVKGHSGNKYNELADSIADYRVHDEYLLDIVLPTMEHGGNIPVIEPSTADLMMVNMSLTSKGIKVNTKEIHGVEDKPKSYRFKGGLVMKRNINKVKTILKNKFPTTSLSYYVYCKPEDEAEMIDKLKAEMGKRLDEVARSVDELRKGIETDIIWYRRK